MIVIKVGGGQGVDLDRVCRDVASLWSEGQKLVLVHGGSHETNLLSERLGKPPRFVTSASGHLSRYTDRETLEIFTMVYAGKVNKLIVERLQRLGANAVGLCGADGRLFQGQRKATLKIIEGGKRKVLRDDYTGKVERVNVELIRLLLDNGYLPVVCPPAISYEGELVNVDGDRAAAALAEAMRAEKLIILSNVPGLLRDVEDEGSLIWRIPRGEVQDSLSYAKGRMVKKVMGAQEALQGGVGQVVFADSRAENPVRGALAGEGTVIG